MSEPFGYTIFCDDIREEVGGKFSYMGRYFTEMHIVGPAPIALAKLAMAVNLILPRPFPGGTIRIVTSVETSDDVTTLHDITLKDLADDPSQPGDVLFTGSNLVASPMIFNGDSTIKVRAYADEREIKAGTLRVRVVEATSSPITGPAGATS